MGCNDLNDPRPGSEKAKCVLCMHTLTYLTWNEVWELETWVVPFASSWTSDKLLAFLSIPLPYENPLRNKRPLDPKTRAV